MPVGGEEANVTIRTWGEQLPRVQPGNGEVGADARAGQRDVGAEAPLGARRGARHHRPGARREDRRLGLPGLQGRRLGARARADPVVHGHAHRRVRVHRGLAAGRRQRGQRARHGPDPGQGRPDVRRHARQPVPGPDRRGAGHEPAPRRDHRRRRRSRSGTARTPRASGARPARRARTRAGSSASTSSTRSRWSCSSDRTRLPRHSSG